MAYAYRGWLPQQYNTVTTGALSAPGSTIVQSITTAEQQGALTDEDGAAVYRAGKDTRGGQRQWWIEMGMGIGGGFLVGYLISKAF